MQRSIELQNLAERFLEDKQLQERLVFAEKISKKYKFEEPAIVLFFTHPTLSTLALKERCAKLGILEEKFLILTAQPGFKRFLSDFQDSSIVTLRAQSFDKLGTAITRDRHKFDKYGNELDDLDIEHDLVKQVSQEKAPQQQVNVQVNLFDKARQRLLT